MSSWRATFRLIGRIYWWRLSAAIISYAVVIVSSAAVLYLLSESEYSTILFYGIFTIASEVIGSVVWVLMYAAISTFWMGGLRNHNVYCTYIPGVISLLLISPVEVFPIGRGDSMALIFWTVQLLAAPWLFNRLRSRSRNRLVHSLRKPT